MLQMRHVSRVQSRLHFCPALGQRFDGLPGIQTMSPQSSAAGELPRTSVFRGILEGQARPELLQSGWLETLPTDK